MSLLLRRVMPGLLLLLVYGPGFAQECDLSSLQSKLQTVQAEMLREVPEKYATDQSIDQSSLHGYTDALTHLRQCQIELKQDVTPCDQIPSMELHFQISSAVHIQRSIQFLEVPGHCDDDLGMTEKMVNSTGRILAYAQNALWILSYDSLPVCSSPQLGTTRRHIVLSGKTDLNDPELFMVDFPEKDGLPYPIKDYLGEKIWLRTNATLKITEHGPSIRFSWSNDAFVDINATQGQIEGSNFLNRQTYSGSCKTLSRQGSLFYPDLQLSAEASTWVERVEEIQP